MSVNHTYIEKTVGQHLAPHEIIADNPLELSHELLAFEVNNVGFASIRYSDDVLIDNVELEDCYLLHCTEAAGNYINRQNQNVDLLPRQIQITVPNQPNQYFIPEKSKHIAFRIPSKKLEELCGITEADGRWLQEHLAETCTNAERSLVLEDIFSHAQELVSRQNAKQTQRNEIELGLLLDGALGLLFDRKARSRFNMPNGRFLAPPDYLFSAKKLMDQAISENISITDIASTIGVSDRSLRTVFLQFFGQSPQQYLRLARLQRLHDLICDIDSEDSISNLMLDCGISSWGRYATYFQMEFGCSPSELRVQKQNRKIN